MSDVFTREKRSEVMSRIRGRGNRGTELVFVSLLRRHRLKGWRRHYPVLGRPDFAFPRAKVAVFIDGCFWHRCPKCSNLPATNRDFWELKLTNNVKRDRLVTRALRSHGWQVLRIWEHTLRAPASKIRKLQGLLAASVPMLPRNSSSARVPIDHSPHE